MPERAGASPLKGRTIAITRPREQGSALAERLRALGASVLHLPTIAIEPPPSWEPLDRALQALATYDWLVVTSASAARSLGQRREALGLRPASPMPRVAAIGPATARALAEAGFAVDLLPQVAVAESLAEALSPLVGGKRVLFPRAETAREVLPGSLRAAGAEVTIVCAYRTVADRDAASVLARVLPTVDAVAFASSSSVRNLFTLLDEAGLPWPESVRAISIGPITSQALREHSIAVEEASAATLDGLVEAALRVFTERG